MHRTIWLYYFVTGLLSFAAGLPAMDDWASALVPDLPATACRLGAAGAELSRAELSLCLAAGFATLRDLAGDGVSLLFRATTDMSAAQWMRTADVAILLIGSLCAAIALIWGWATLMTRMAALSMAGSYTLVRAVGTALERR